MGDLVACGMDVTATVSQFLAFLITLQTTALQSTTPSNDSSFDPKTYVDLPFLKSLNETQNAFKGLPRVSGPNGNVVTNETLQSFLAEYFGEPGSELVVHHAADFTKRPVGFLPKVHNPEALKWAHDVHEIWLNLSREVKPDVGAYPDQYTMIPIPNPFVIPGEFAHVLSYQLGADEAPSCIVVCSRSSHHLSAFNFILDTLKVFPRLT